MPRLRRRGTSSAALRTGSTTRRAAAAGLGNRAQRALASGGVTVRGRAVPDAVLRALVAAPTLAATRAALTAAGGDGADMGVTDPPAGFAAPTYNIATHAADGGGFTATVAKTGNADEGTNASFYLGPGVHSTGLMIANGALTNYVAGPGNKEIYGEVTNAIANNSRDAEQEHVDDHQRAFDITLDAAEDAIDDGVAQSPHGPALTAPLAQAAAEGYMDGRVTHYTGLLGANNFQITANLGNLYTNKVNMTQQRDAQLWHHFRPNTAAQSTSPAAWLHWAMSLGAHDVRVIQQHPAFSVGATASAALIV